MKSDDSNEKKTQLIYLKKEKEISTKMMRKNLKKIN